ncbi:MAG TPA: PAS domain-containing protein [Caulobacteraceae bacterium]|nr:PAS domain-containing protein [Caulobacteraceae bacterium]
MSTQLSARVTALRAHEELFGYWARLRRQGVLPGRADLDPAGFKRLLPTVSLIEVRRNPRDYRLRLAGTGLYGVYGGEITGKPLRDIYNAAAGDYWRGELDHVVEEAKPRVGHHSMAWRGAAHMTLLWLRLPLASNGRDVDVILGYDAVLTAHGDAFGGVRAA